MLKIKKDLYGLNNGAIGLRFELATSSKQMLIAQNLLLQIYIAFTHCFSSPQKTHPAGVGVFRGTPQ